jgi:hypothetical protein
VLPDAIVIDETVKVVAGVKNVKKTLPDAGAIVREDASPRG